MNDAKQKKTLLVVEDNEINREMLKAILSDDYKVLEACDGEEGIGLLRTHLHELSLVLLDVQMPRMNGYEFLEQCGKEGLLNVVPVIVTTGSTLTENEEKCLALGASDYVTKPYNPRIILRRIEAIIRLKESISALQVIERDSVTGLYTGSAFFFHAKRMLDGTDDDFDMLLIEVEELSYVGARYGDKTGDELLKHITSRILSYGADGVLACRFDTDKFVLLRRHTACDHHILAKDFDAVLHDGSPVPGFSVKFAAYDKVEKDKPVSELCDRLLITVSTIREQYGRLLAVYDDAIVQKTNRVRRMGDLMESSLQNGEFKVWYQPKHDAKTGRLSGAEALVRWIHPEYGFLSPAEFIPLFEQNGFITQVDLFVWNTVCRDLKEWKEAGLSPVPVSVNASRRDFLSVNDLGLLLDPISENGLDRSLLHLEITESLGVGDKAILEKVNKVRSSGIAIELDDFGAGQSSLGSLSDIPMDYIKLDMSFVRALDKQKELVRIMVSLAHALGLKTVAEGVETDDNVATLRKLGCDYLQGYYYSKPLPATEFKAYLEKETSK